MTDRVNGLFVVLSTDIREDEIVVLIDAIKLLRGVIAVSTNKVTPEAYLAQERARHELREKLMDVLYEH